MRRKILDFKARTFAIMAFCTNEENSESFNLESRETMIKGSTYSGYTTFYPYFSLKTSTIIRFDLYSSHPQFVVMMMQNK